jgi:hypothetical protein
MKIQFILKKNETYGFLSYTRKSSGLWNSTNFIAQGLRDRGFSVDIVEVNDNNCIDREVTRFRPDLVVIEALWVVPEKFPVLQKLHPSVQWFCHLHSDMPFLALEGSAMQWILAYPTVGVKLIANSLESYKALRAVIHHKNITYLPNVYRVKAHHPERHDRHHVLHIACMGAVRPLKNHLIQALAAIRFAKEQDKTLHFLINSSRVETGGAPVLKNLQKLFEATPNAYLIELPWLEHNDVIQTLRHKVDLGMQVSLTETFNVVSADYVAAGIPIVVSKEVKWASRLSMAKDNSIDDIVAKMRRAYNHRWIIGRNQNLLRQHQSDAENSWVDWVFSNRRMVE